MRRYIRLAVCIHIFCILGEHVCRAQGQYKVFDSEGFTLSLPSSWHRVPTTYLQEVAKLIKELAAKNPSIKPEWGVYECGFQADEWSGDIGAPSILIHISRDPKKSERLLNGINKLSQEQVTLSFDEAWRFLGKEMMQSFGGAVKSVVIDKKTKLIRVTTVAVSGTKSVQVETFMYLGDTKVCQVICTFKDPNSPKEIATLRHIGNSLKLKASSSTTR